MASVYAVIAKLRIAKQPMLPAFLLLLPALLVGAAGTLYVKYDFELFSKHPHAVLLFLGFAVSNLTVCAFDMVMNVHGNRFELLLDIVWANGLLSSMCHHLLYSLLLLTL